MEKKQTTSHGHFEDDSITRISTLADNPFFKLKPTGTIYKPIQPNVRSSGRGTVCVPLSNFNGVSENAGFSSKLKFVSSTGNCADLHCAGSVTSGKVTDTLTFKVIAAGSTQISAKSYSIILEDETEAATKVDATSINASNTAPSNKPST